MLRGDNCHRIGVLHHIGSLELGDAVVKHSEHQAGPRHSLFSIARIFGGKLPNNRATLVTHEPLEAPREIVLVFPKPHVPRRRATGSRHLSVVAFEDTETQPDRAMLAEPARMACNRDGHLGDRARVQQRPHGSDDRVSTEPSYRQ